MLPYHFPFFICKCQCKTRHKPINCIMKGGLYKFSSNRSKFSLVHFVKIKEAKTKKNIFLGILLTLDQLLKPFFFHLLNHRNTTEEMISQCNQFLFQNAPYQLSKSTKNLTPRTKNHLTNDLLSATNFYFNMHCINYQSPQKIWHQGIKIIWRVRLGGKVHIFWEGHKSLRNLYLTFDWYYIGQN